ncbi:MAG TPA: glycosyltransferase [Steroidobacteraceae bacterium]|nr:glycosyltransferase [Steroidobacteraceae bacterium]
MQSALQASASATVIIPTVGRAVLRRCVASVLGQSHAPVQAYVVCDGPQFHPQVQQSLEGLDTARIRLLVLPENVGSGGYYGHRALAGCSHFVNCDYVLFLDEDNWYEPEHVAGLIATIQRFGLDWAFSLRRVVARDGEFVVRDDCESLGAWPGWRGHHLVDTSCYCLKRGVAAAAASAWHGGWGQDRVYLKTLATHFPRYRASGAYTVNYRLGGNPGSVTAEFFHQGNEFMRQRYPAGFPWSAGH